MVENNTKNKVRVFKKNRLSKKTRGWSNKQGGGSNKAVGQINKVRGSKKNG